MEHRFVINPAKCALAAASCLLLAVMCGCMVYIGRLGSALIFGLLAAVFAVVAVHNGSALLVDSSGIAQLLLGRRRRALAWDQIAEVGVVGTKVFNSANPSKTGSLYIYFSDTAMTEQERFEMIVKWPPSHKPHMVYDNRRIEVVQALWDAKVQTYNTGDLVL